MTRRQRLGLGGKDHHGCGTAACDWCHPEKNSRPRRIPTRQEKAADLELAEETKGGMTPAQAYARAWSKLCNRCRWFGVGYCGCDCYGVGLMLTLLFDDC